ncbi:MAG TPA: sugar ABC transporter ATP-binding protein [Trueperaceae bacterium]|nr:sugar ABC transporter ATP-binding protein [Trueperaceae bacterium]
MLELNGLGKSFAGVSALQGVSCELPGGAITGLLGANGAGKSTLIKVLTGYYTSYQGEVRLDGRTLPLTRPSVAKAHGIHVVHQEVDTSIVPDLSVAENLLLDDIIAGRITTRDVLRSRRVRQEARNVMAPVGLDLEPGARAGDLGLHTKQLLVIARALNQNLRYLILDEPTASLSLKEVDQLFAVVQDLRRQGTGIVFVSHKLPEVMRLCDQALVLRDGQLAGAFDRPFEAEALVAAILGMPLDQEFPARVERPRSREPVLEVDGVEVGSAVKGVGFRAYAGEVLAITGLVGAGKTELLRAIYGLERPDRGTVGFLGRPLRIRHPHQAIERGIFFVPEERRSQGLFIDYSGDWNLAFPSLSSLAPSGFVSTRRERALSRRLADNLDVKGPMDEPVAVLSGGNQQKVAIGKWLARKPKALLMDEPTRGVDIGARLDIYNHIRDLSADAAVVVATSDIDEALGIADRIIVMFGGRVMAELGREEATREAVMRLAVGAT